jgi:hypothetical protein
MSDDNVVPIRQIPPKQSFEVTLKEAGGNPRYCMEGDQLGLTLTTLGVPQQSATKLNLIFLKDGWITARADLSDPKDDWIGGHQHPWPEERPEVWVAAKRHQTSKTPAWLVWIVSVKIPANVKAQHNDIGESIYEFVSSIVDPNQTPEPEERPCKHCGEVLSEHSDTYDDNYHQWEPGEST